MAEVEAKLRIDCARLSELRSRLGRLGAVLEGEEVEEDTYFQHPCRDFRATDEALRVRRAGGRIELTYKGPKRVVHGVKARAELTATVGDGVERILEALGFKPVAVVRKRRSYYLLGRPRVKVSLDVVEGLGCFVEVEALEGGVKAVEEAIRLLGLEEAERITKSYLELYLELHGKGSRAARG